MITAEAHLATLIPGIEVATTLPNHFVVSHPKRVLTVNSFANAAKKLGLIHHGTRSATNRNQFIVLYVSMDATMEFCFKHDNTYVVTAQAQVPRLV